MNLIFAILIQAPYQPYQPKYPESNIVIERVMLRGKEPELTTKSKKLY